ncbi:cell division protein FtsZ [Frigoriflavimonas asaccharolytica]|uniref:Cell division protein FtsZ n=1 Tax=Frigoriflavimonas asaccharolytica TaxID=2735899 RepID=A0A8J8G4R6_9FLAO|nr:cell division protein FtsZ [Frigoriflavimonas asaccharolytica]NRS91133.1 cell division protein FtsZ [Frigoriflavimonas asaccharolytica]
MDNNIATQGFSFDLPKGNSSIIKVIGVGGGGNNALKHMYERGINGVDFVVCNTDAQTLDNNPVAHKVQLGITMTEGLGAGADPEVGEKAAIESIDEIKAALGQNTKMVFITAGMGGGTGTGAAPVIAKIAREMGILTIGIVTIPFSFEGKRRLDQAELGLEKLRENVDSLIVINNDKLRQQFGNLGFKQGFAKADEVLTNAAKGMAEVITGYFDVNIDFRDAKSVLANSGTALISTGLASGENKAEEAVRKALDSPLLNDNKITGAKNVLLLIRSGSEEVTMDEIGVIMDHIQKEAGHTAEIIFGVGSDEELGDAVSVLVIATGFAKENRINDGYTEKIKYTLADKRPDPFTSNANTEENSAPVEKKSLFHLEDDEDFDAENFGNKFSEKKSGFEIKNESRETKIEAQQISREDFSAENEHKEVDLFSYDDIEDDEPTSESFSFDIENKKEDASKPKGGEVEKIFFSDEKPVEFTFSSEKSFETFEESKEKYAQSQAPIIEDKMVIEQKMEEVAVEIEEETIIETSGDFIFKSKNSGDSEKVLDRRNKLKEFNSRYQVTDLESDFETIPAFRRKNILIEGQNQSEQRINSYLTENDKGQMQVRENKFLNKDVD